VLAAAWQVDDRYRAGWLALRAGQSVTELGAIDVPTRAHHVGVDRAGRLLAVARRPGDWLLSVAAPGSAPLWHWIEPSRAFNGHAITSPDGRRVLTTETDLDSGAGLIGVRDAATLAKLDEWPTAGIDPHQLLWDAGSACGLFVANGGVATRPETGRTKHELARMDSSLARLDARDGRLSGQWRLGDPRLGLRHLAWHHAPGGRQLGIALQSEHDSAEARADAPVLALFDGQALRAAPSPMPLAGYGGDIAGSANGFVISCPRAGGLARFDAAGGWQGFSALPQACALAATTPGRHVLAAGLPRAVDVEAADEFELGALRVDNHWAWVG
jgi:hypothetical protein